MDADGAAISGDSDGRRWVDTRLPDIGVVWDESDFDAAAVVEQEFLTALVWAPPGVARQVVTALVGAEHARAAGRPDDAIPMSSALFLSPRHEVVFAAIVDVVDRGAPPTPVLVANRLTERGERSRVQGIMVDLAAPARAPLPGGVELPHLAASLANAWYRRGYIALTMRMQQCTREVDHGDLAASWRALTDHQQAAERRWHGVHAHLGAGALTESDAPAPEMHSPPSLAAATAQIALHGTAPAAGAVAARPATVAGPTNSTTPRVPTHQRRRSSDAER